MQNKLLGSEVFLPSVIKCHMVATCTHEWLKRSCTIYALSVYVNCMYLRKIKGYDKNMFCLVLILQVVRASIILLLTNHSSCSMGEQFVVMHTWCYGLPQ